MGASISLRDTNRDLTRAHFAFSFKIAPNSWCFVVQTVCKAGTFWFIVRSWTLTTSCSNTVIAVLSLAVEYDVKFWQKILICTFLISHHCIRLSKSPFFSTHFPQNQITFPQNPLSYNSFLLKYHKQLLLTWETIENSTVHRWWSEKVVGKIYDWLTVCLTFWEI